MIFIFTTSTENNTKIEIYEKLKKEKKQRW